MCRATILECFSLPVSFFLFRSLSFPVSLFLTLLLSSLSSDGRNVPLWRGITFKRYIIFKHQKKQHVHNFSHKLCPNVLFPLFGYDAPRRKIDIFRHFSNEKCLPAYYIYTELAHQIWDLFDEANAIFVDKRLKIIKFATQFSHRITSWSCFKELWKQANQHNTLMLIASGVNE